MVSGLCNPNLYDTDEYVKETTHLTWGEGHFRLYNPKHDFYHVVHTAPTIYVVPDAQIPL